MTLEGTLTRWNHERGFGFITPLLGGAEVFAHISAFDRDGRTPVVGERLWFDLGVDPRGRRKALRVWRMGVTVAAVGDPAGPTRRASADARRRSGSGQADGKIERTRHREQRWTRSRPSGGGRLLQVLVMTVIAGILVSATWSSSNGRLGRWLSGSLPWTSTSDMATPHSPDTAETLFGTPQPSPFRCDGRTHCSQMRSCEEATYFIRQCPGVEMDGDNDGIPCENQWCGH